MPPKRLEEPLFRPVGCDKRASGAGTPDFDSAYTRERRRTEGGLTAAGGERFAILDLGFSISGVFAAHGRGNPKSAIQSPKCFNPHNFQPFGGFSDGAVVRDGALHPPQAPGIGFETRSALDSIF